MTYVALIKLISESEWKPSLVWFVVAPAIEVDDESYGKLNRDSFIFRYIRKQVLTVSCEVPKVQI